MTALARATSAASWSVRYPIGVPAMRAKFTRDDIPTHMTAPNRNRIANYTALDTYGGVS